MGDTLYRHTYMSFCFYTVGVGIYRQTLPWILGGRTNKLFYIRETLILPFFYEIETFRYLKLTVY